MVQSSLRVPNRPSDIECYRARDLQYLNRAPLPVRIVPAFSWQTHQRNTKTRGPPPVVRKDRRDDFTPSFQAYYARADFPIVMDFTEQKISWKKDLPTLNHFYYLPIFFEGLRETEHPYNLLAVQGSYDLIDQAADKLIPLLPQLVRSVHKALSTRNAAVICDTLKVLQHLVKSSPEVGKAMVCYYKQILPRLNMYKDLDHKNDGDLIDYSQMKRTNIGDLVEETLNALEVTGGDDALQYIKFMVPTYQSCVVRCNIK